jgi:DNA ligase (NAD+)
MVIDYIEYISKKREQIPYPIDGMVVKVNDINIYDILGSTSKFPKWATAFKFPPEIVETKLLNIQATVGRTGRITYVADLQPILLDGSHISSASLHNATYIINNDIRINDIVKVFKAAEIIPKVIGPVITKHHQDNQKFKPITHCPRCNTLLEKQEDEADQYCTNISCPARILQSMIHFASKKAMNIEDLSEKNLQKLYEAKIINKIQDIYQIKNKKNLILENDFKIKEKMFQNLVNNVETSKNNSLEKLIFAIGIRHVGENTAKILAKTFRTIDSLANASLEELFKVKDVGEVVAISIVDFFKNEANQQLIKDLKAIGVNMSFISNFEKGNLLVNSPYYQKTFVITGSFDISRHEIERKLEEKYDAILTNTISKTTDFLIVGENGGSKELKANKLKIPILREKI